MMKIVSIWTKIKWTRQTSALNHCLIKSGDICSLFSRFPPLPLWFLLKWIKERNCLGRLLVHCLSAPALPFIACSATMETDSLTNISPLPGGTTLTFVSWIHWRGAGGGSFSPWFCCAPSAGSCSVQLLALWDQQLTPPGTPLSGSAVSFTGIAPLHGRLPWHPLQGLPSKFRDMAPPTGTSLEPKSRFQTRATGVWHPVGQGCAVFSKVWLSAWGVRALLGLPCLSPRVIGCSLYMQFLYFLVFFYCLAANPPLFQFLVIVCDS